MSENMDYPIPPARELTPGEQQIEVRIARCTEFIKNGIVASAERNGKVVAMAILNLLEHNPDLANEVESYCGNFKVRVVLREARRLKGVKQELKAKGIDT
jgi:hypothetical protein